MSKLQCCSESNSAAIFELNSLPGKIFIELQIGIFFLEIGKRGIFWIGNEAYYLPLVIGRKKALAYYILAKSQFLCTGMVYTKSINNRKFTKKLS